MPSEDNKVLEFNQYQKFDKTASIIYADLQLKTSWCDFFFFFFKLSTTKVSQHTPCGYLVSTIWTFDGIKNKNDVYRDKDYIKIFCESLSELSNEDN